MGKLGPIIKDKLMEYQDGQHTENWELLSLQQEHEELEEKVRVLKLKNRLLKRLQVALSSCYGEDGKRERSLEEVDIFLKKAQEIMDELSSNWNIFEEDNAIEFGSNLQRLMRIAKSELELVN